jgi:hypothetical protein
VRDAYRASDVIYRIRGRSRRRHRRRSPWRSMERSATCSS